MTWTRTAWRGLRGRAVFTVLCLAASAVHPGCGRERGDGPGAPRGIVLVVIDTTRADRLSFMGRTDVTTPFLDSLAARSAVFEHARSASSWTAPATASIFTSRYPLQHGVWTGLKAATDASLPVNMIPDELETIPEVLAGLGYRTFGVSDNLTVGDRMGFDRGFDSFRVFSNSGAGTLNDTVREWLPEIEKSERYFLYLHYMEPHKPYRRHDRWFRRGSARDHLARLGEWGRGTAKQRRRVRRDLERYDSELGAVDGKIAELFELLGWERDTLLIITADHGEEFRDHGGIYHRRGLYGELVNVPLVVFFPARAPARRIGEIVSTIDILPTIREAAGGALSPGDLGVSLFPYLEGNPPAPRALFAQRRKEMGREGEVSLDWRAVFSGRWKYVVTRPGGREELYDLDADPGEQADAAGRQPVVAAGLRGRLEEFERTAETVPRAFNDAAALTDEERAQLRTLGYVK